MCVPRQLAGANVCPGEPVGSPHCFAEASCGSGSSSISGISSSHGRNAAAVQIAIGQSSRRYYARKRLTYCRQRISPVSRLKRLVSMRGTKLDGRTTSRGGCTTSSTDSPEYGSSHLSDTGDSSQSTADPATWRIPNVHPVERPLAGLPRRRPTRESSPTLSCLHGKTPTMPRFLCPLIRTSFQRLNTCRQRTTSSSTRRGGASVTSWPKSAGRRSRSIH